jgi:hypothetical protein
VEELYSFKSAMEMTMAVGKVERIYGAEIREGLLSLANALSENFD